MTQPREEMMPPEDDLTVEGTTTFVDIHPSLHRTVHALPAPPPAPLPPKRRNWSSLWGLLASPFRSNRPPEGLTQTMLFLLSRFRYDGKGLKPRVVVLVGDAPKAGATSIAAGLAEQFGQDMSGRVLLVDPRPTRSKLRQRLDGEQIHPPPAPGGNEDDVRAGAVVLRSRSGGFDVLQVTDPRGATEAAFRKYAAQSYTIYNLIIIDAGSLDGKMIHRVNGIADSTLLVVNSRRTTTYMLERIKATLAARNLTIDGIVLNRCRTYVPRWLGGRA